MTRRFLTLLTCSLLLTTQALADEGMWLMQQLKAQLPKMQARGLKLQDYDLYNEQGSSLRDAVVIFDRGCTGEVISSQGLILTNHHCGYDAIQGLSSVERNYLENGYWAQSLDEELPAKGVTITFIDRIEDVTDYVKSKLKGKSATNMDYLSPSFLSGLAKARAGQTAPGIEVEIKPFYNGNRYLMFTKKVYSDIRFVGAPPSSIGKFGADTDNWAYPRHTGDFSIFRVYADDSGNPAPYSPTNKPLRPKRWFNISTGGIQQGQFMMVMGFPGRTNRFFLPEEVEEWKRIDNDIRIRMRGIRQEVMLAEMLANPQTNIQYAAKYAYSQNGYKRAIGANWGIAVRNLAEDKRRQMQSLLDWAKPKERMRYEAAITDIRSSIEARAELRRRMWYMLEGFVYGVELVQLPSLSQQDAEAQATFYRDFDPKVDAKIASAILSDYLKQLRPDEYPLELQALLSELGSTEALIEALYRSKYMSLEGLKQLSEAKAKAKQNMQAYQYETIQVGGRSVQPDLLVERFANMVRSEYRSLNEQASTYDNKIDQARRVYVGGLLAQHGDDNLWPDANSTLRFTYGNIIGYQPRDGVSYEPQTYLDGVMAKEDSTSWEFVVPERLKEIYRTQSYGKNKRWAERTPEGGWRMPVNFCATSHTTGGNSGSPVMDGKGNLIGINFDRNWEGVGGDIQYLADYQRSIICDIRYIMMIIEEYGHCHRLLEEMTFVD